MVYREVVHRTIDVTSFACNSTKGDQACVSTAMAVTDGAFIFGGRMAYEAGGYLFLKVEAATSSADSAAASSSSDGGTST